MSHSCIRLIQRQWLHPTPKPNYQSLSAPSPCECAEFGLCPNGYGEANMCSVWQPVSDQSTLKSTEHGSLVEALESPSMWVNVADENIIDIECFFCAG
jgi:hypothetical protein